MQFSLAGATHRNRWKTLLGLAGAMVALMLAVPMAAVPAWATGASASFLNYSGQHVTCLSANNEPIPGGPSTSHLVYGVLCSNSPYQYWAYDADAEPEIKTTTIVNLGNGRCLSSNNSTYPGLPSGGHEVYTVPCSSSEYQRWWPITQTGLTFTLRNAGSGWCLSMNETPLPGQPSNTTTVFTTKSCSPDVEYHTWMTLS